LGKKREKKFVGSVFKHLPVFILERTVMGKCAPIQSISGTPLSPPARKKKKDTVRDRKTYVPHSP